MLLIMLMRHYAGFISLWRRECNLNSTIICFDEYPKGGYHIYTTGQKDQLVPCFEPLLKWFSAQFMNNPYFSVLLWYNWSCFIYSSSIWASTTRVSMSLWYRMIWRRCMRRVARRWGSVHKMVYSIPGSWEVHLKYCRSELILRSWNGQGRIGREGRCENE